VVPAGEVTLEGGHQSAVKSTSTGCSAATTSSSKVASVTVTIVRDFLRELAAGDGVAHLGDDLPSDGV